MSKIKSKNTKIEVKVADFLRKESVWYRRGDSYPGKPDFIVKGKRAVFIDGDFWHGYRFQEWEKKLAPFWRKKIGGNILRDRKKRAKLRRGGWKTLRVWEHELKKDEKRAFKRILKFVA